jgi:diguanylate cyclase (GGDEF)-like protein
MGRSALLVGGWTRHRWLLSPGGWELWRQPRGLLGYYGVTAVMAVAATVAVAVVVPVGESDWVILSVLAGTGIVQAELGRRIEWARSRVVGVVHINMTSVWLLPAVLLLSPALTALLVVVLYWHLYARSGYRAKRVPVFRMVLSIFVTILTCYITRTVALTAEPDGVHAALQAGWDGLATIAVGIGTYFVVNASLAVPALHFTSRDFRDLLGGWDDNVLELATLCLGGLTALAMAASPALAVLVVAPLFVLHRAVLITQLQSAARRDVKTGVWNVAGWHGVAHHEFARAKRRTGASFGVLMVDLDHFKRINDSYGHLAGDAVLKDVADTIVATVRPGDSVGRFGGEEFVVLLPDIAEPDSRAVAERIRVAISRIEVRCRQQPIRGLSASIGIATYPTAGATIEALLQAADAAMYRAKANGRNRVMAAADAS